LKLENAENRDKAVNDTFELLAIDLASEISIYQGPRFNTIQCGYAANNPISLKSLDLDNPGYTPALPNQKP